MTKEEFEELLTQMNKIRNQLSPEREYQFWMSEETMKKWNIVFEKESKKFRK